MYRCIWKNKVSLTEQNLTSLRYTSHKCYSVTQNHQHVANIYICINIKKIHLKFKATFLSATISNSFRPS